MHKALGPTLIIITLFLFGCGGSSEEDKPNDFSEFIGTWALSCTDGHTVSYTFSNNQATNIYTRYEDIDCSGNLLSSTTYENYLIHSENFMDASGVTTTKAQMIIPIEEGNQEILIDVTLLIYRREQELYIGNEAINFDNAYLLQ